MMDDLWGLAWMAPKRRNDAWRQTGDILQSKGIIFSTLQ